MLLPWQPLLVAVAQSVHKYAGEPKLPTNASNCVLTSTIVGLVRPILLPGVALRSLRRAGAWRQVASCFRVTRT